MIYIYICSYLSGTLLLRVEEGTPYPQKLPRIGWLRFFRRQPLLVGGDWNMDFIFPYIGKFIVGNVIIPIDELVLFRGVGLNHQPVLQLY